MAFLTKFWWFVIRDLHGGDRQAFDQSVRLICDLASVPGEILSSA